MDISQTTDDSAKAENTGRGIVDLIETYRQGFLQLEPKLFAGIWDREYVPLIYVAMEKPEPMYGWPAIREYYAALPQHLEEVIAKEIEDLSIDVLGDSAVAFFKFHSTVRLKGREGLHQPRGRVTMLLRHTPDGWRVIHFHESALAAQAANASAK